MREYSICIDMFALLYSKLSNGADMVNKNIINEYYEEFQKRANEMGKTIFFEITSYSDDPQLVFKTLRDTENNVYSILRPRYVNGKNLEEIWDEHLSHQDKDLIYISINPKLLSVLGINSPKNILKFYSKKIDNFADDYRESVKNKTSNKVRTRK